MKTLLVTLALIFALTGCSSIPENPKMAFGKKCEVTPDGTVVTSHVWIYNKETGLTANKDDCEQLEKK
tara:strand:- start:564 stop:767 length:204 start_codon:yes stop_codon:yes gene_type:complete